MPNAAGLTSRHRAVTRSSKSRAGAQVAPGPQSANSAQSGEHSPTRGASVIDTQCAPGPQLTLLVQNPRHTSVPGAPSDTHTPPAAQSSFASRVLRSRVHVPPTGTAPDDGTQAVTTVPASVSEKVHLGLVSEPQVCLTGSQRVLSAQTLSQLVSQVARTSRPSAHWYRPGVKDASFTHDELRPSGRHHQSGNEQRFALEHG